MQQGLQSNPCNPGLPWHLRAASISAAPTRLLASAQPLCAADGCIRRPHKPRKQQRSPHVRPKAAQAPYAASSSAALHTLPASMQSAPKWLKILPTPPNFPLNCTDLTCHCPYSPPCPRFPHYQLRDIC